MLHCVYGDQHRMQARLFAVLKCPEITHMFCATLSILITEIRFVITRFMVWWQGVRSVLFVVFRAISVKEYKFG